MEGNNQSMGVPSSGPINMISSPGSGSYAAIHQRNPEVSPLSTTSVVHTPAPVRPDVTRSGVTPGPPQEGARAMTGLIVTSVSSSTPAYLSSAPLYPPDVSTALVPHSGGTNPSGFAGFGTVKKKRGRPRKYAPDGGIALSVTPLSSMPSSMSPSQKPSSMSPSQKRGRGRPRGSGKKQQLAALGSGGVGFTPHAITVAAGEDVATRIMSFSQQGPRGVCILSANGAISNVTLRQPAISGGTVTYEGRFEILSLSGSFLLTDSGGTRSRTGGLSVSLAGPDGRVLGGGVAGMLIAASPVQVVVGSFINLTKKVHKIVPKVENALNQSALDAAPNSGNAADVADDVKPTIPDDVKPTIPESSPQNHGMATSSDSGSPQGQIIPAQPFGWPAPHVLQEGRPNTDIDMSLPGG